MNVYFETPLGAATQTDWADLYSGTAATATFFVVTRYIEKRLGTALLP